MTDLERYMAQREATLLADELIAKATQSEQRKSQNVSVCLVTHFGKRPELPDGTWLIKMSPEVVKQLGDVGLHEPISLRLLPNKWWVANVDVAAVNPIFEPGGGTYRVVATTVELISCYGGYYCEVMRGPFDSRGEVDD